MDSLAEVDLRDHRSWELKVETLWLAVKALFGVHRRLEDRRDVAPGVDGLGDALRKRDYSVGKNIAHVPQGGVAVHRRVL